VFTIYIYIYVFTAAEMLKQNIEPRIEHIKEISFAMKTFPAILDKGDYIALRGGIYMNLLCVCN
jgi:hypothetical protein